MPCIRTVQLKDVLRGTLSHGHV
uniref:Uncharacterized protein n=1 Tax=Arundo donax TaxID=35708 RepID=A0A0A8YV11_ARUDO